MIRVQYRDGQTLAFDLRKETDRIAWDTFKSRKGWSDSITAMGIHCRKNLYALPVPSTDIKSHGFGAALIVGKPKKKVLGESVWFCVDNLRIELQVYNTNQKVTKVTVMRLSGLEG